MSLSLVLTTFSLRLQEYLQGNFVSVSRCFGEGEHWRWYVNSAVCHQHAFVTFRIIRAHSFLTYFYFAVPSQRPLIANTVWHTTSWAQNSSKLCPPWTDHPTKTCSGVWNASEPHLSDLICNPQFCEGRDLEPLSRTVVRTVTQNGTFWSSSRIKMHRLLYAESVMAAGVQRVDTLDVEHCLLFVRLFQTAADELNSMEGGWIFSL